PSRVLCIGWARFAKSDSLTKMDGNSGPIFFYLTQFTRTLCCKPMAIAYDQADKIKEKLFIFYS
ncbi:MAG: hypothetical protein AB2531_03180, partial [Candidatus Thiodiazotropha sp.]